MDGVLAEFDRVIGLHRLKALHIHDNNGVRDEHLPLSEGSIPWDKIMPKIVKEYKGKIIVVEGRNPEEGKKSLEFLKRWF